MSTIPQEIKVKEHTTTHTVYHVDSIDFDSLEKAKEYLKRKELSKFLHNYKCKIDLGLDLGPYYYVANHRQYEELALAIEEVKMVNMYRRTLDKYTEFPVLVQFRSEDYDDDEQLTFTDVLTKDDLAALSELLNEGDSYNGT